MFMHEKTVRIADTSNHLGGVYMGPGGHRGCCLVEVRFGATTLMVSDKRLQKRIRRLRY